MVEFIDFWKATKEINEYQHHPYTEEEVVQMAYDLWENFLICKKENRISEALSLMLETVVDMDDNGYNDWVYLVKLEIGVIDINKPVTIEMPRIKCPTCYSVFRYAPRCTTCGQKIVYN